MKPTTIFEDRKGKLILNSTCIPDIALCVMDVTSENAKLLRINFRTHALMIIPHSEGDEYGESHQYPDVKKLKVSYIDIDGTRKEVEVTLNSNQLTIIVPQLITEICT
jgi:hypothetical protein